MGEAAVKIQNEEGKTTGMSWDKSLVDVFDEASEPLNAFVTLMEDIGNQVCDAPDEGYAPLCSKVLNVLMAEQRRIIAQAVECVDGQVGKIILNAHNHMPENRANGIAGQYCRARIAKREVRS